MIESLRKSESKLLAFSAGCTFGIGGIVGMMVKVFHHGTTGMTSSAGRVVAEWGRDSLEMGAAATASRVAQACIVLWLISNGVWALATLSETHGNARAVVRLSARTLYVLSVIGVVAAISAAVFFMMFRV